MANKHRYGFRWATSANGTPPPQPLRKHIATGQDDQDDTGTSVHIYPGDPVKLVNTGGVIIALGSGGQRETAEAVYGIVVGIAPYWDAGQGCMVRGNHYPNQTAWGTKEERRGFVYVVPAHWGLWEIDCYGTSSSYDTEAEYRAFIGENAEHMLPGSAATGVGYATSADPYLDIATHAYTATLGWRIEDVSTTCENEDFSTNYVKLIVACNENQYGGKPAEGSIVAGV